MERLFNTQFIYQFSDEEIMNEICRRLRIIRQNNFMSQTDFAKEAGVSLSTIKRIESMDIQNISFSVLLKILRAGGSLEGITTLVQELPPPVIRKNKRAYFSKKMRP